MSEHVKQLYLPAGEINPFGNGAAKRSAQINAFLDKHFHALNINKLSTSIFPKNKRYYFGLRKTFTHQIPLKSIKSVSMAGHYFCEAKQIVETYKPKALFWESTWIDYHYKPFFYKDLNLKLFGFPHNLESLVAGHQSPISGRTSPRWFDEELKQLKLCNHLFTISKEENWLLNLLGIPSTYYPYFPPTETETELLKIREQRTSQQGKDFYLIFGSFTYPPIRQGLIELLNFFATKQPDVRLVVTGFGSDLLAQQYQTKLKGDIQFVGPSTTKQLNNYLSQCKGVLINQAASSGALTKIVELQVAGVPVVANLASTRSYDLTKGLYAYHQFEELESILLSNLVAPEKPISPDLIEKMMAYTIYNILNL